MQLIRSISAAASLSLLLAAAPLAHADIVTNGTFSGGSSGWSTTDNGGTTPGGGIQFITLSSDGYGDSVPNINGTSTGAFFVDDNANPETLSQNITLAANTSYQLSFDLFATASGAANPYSFTLSNGSGTVATFSFTNSNTNTDIPVGVWTPEVFDFISTAATSYDLSFDYTSGSTPAKDVILTNVAVGATPEPSSLLLLGSGLLGLAGVARRRFSR